MMVVCCQLDLAWEDRLANFKKVEAMLAQVRPALGSLVVLPEMFATGFSMDLDVVAEDVPSVTEDFLAGQAQRWGVYLVAGVVRRSSSGLGRNQAICVAPEGHILSRYTKIHPFVLGGESESFEAGTEVVRVGVGEWTMATFVCYDLRFPEPFRLAARHGVQLYVVLANWPEKRIEHWMTLLQARAIENQAYVVGVNRCGQDPNLAYNGCSLIVGPTGEVLEKAGHEEGFISATLDRESVLHLRAGLPFLRDMRSDYHQLHISGVAGKIGY